MFLLTNINSLIKTIGILDVIDILVVAYFLFRIYLMLKNTRAAVLVKGLLTLGAIMFISRWLNLHVISWVLEKSMTVLIVALPIVFQPELRRALEQIGRGRLFRKHGELDEYEVDEMVNSITSAAVVMGRRKLGALIVIEREIGLEERIETGVAIDGIISDSLLLNIFEKDTPLHDGAVIIRGNRIAAASCLLPLTEMRNLSQELGKPGAWHAPPCCAWHFGAVRRSYPCCQRGNGYDFPCAQRQFAALFNGGRCEGVFKGFHYAPQGRF